MINFRFIVNIIGKLLLVESAFLMLCIVVALIYGENENKEYLKMIGIDSLIYPERLAAEEIVASLKQSGSRQLHEFSDGRLQLLGIKLWENAPVFL